MINKLIIEFDKNNKEKNITKFYIKFGFPLLIVLQIFFSTEISIILFFILITFILYLYMYLKTENKISKSILYFKKNIINYNTYSNKSNRTWTIDFLKDHNLYNKESILFIIDNLKSKKRIKTKRDWVTIIISICLAFINSSIKEGIIDFNSLINLMIQTTPYIIITIIIFITIKSLKWIFVSTVQVEASIEQLEEILTDEYLNLNS